MYNAKLANLAVQTYETQMHREKEHNANLMLNNIFCGIRAFAENGMRFYILNAEHPVHNDPELKELVLNGLKNQGFQIELTGLTVQIQW